ncbi:hypothetical protein C0J52_04428 [Blattella germanica]|nr:hypothetical protein C0J52_04428 [Blattella germanica]
MSMHMFRGESFSDFRYFSFEWIDNTTSVTFALTHSKVSLFQTTSDVIQTPTSHRGVGGYAKSYLHVAHFVNRRKKEKDKVQE